MLHNTTTDAYKNYKFCIHDIIYVAGLGKKIF